MNTFNLSAFRLAIKAHPAAYMLTCIQINSNSNNSNHLRVNIEVVGQGWPSEANISANELYI